MTHEGERRPGELAKKLNASLKSTRRTVANFHRAMRRKKQGEEAAGVMRKPKPTVRTS